MTDFINGVIVGFGLGLAMAGFAISVVSYQIARRERVGRILSQKMQEDISGSLRGMFGAMSVIRGQVEEAPPDKSKAN